MPEFLLKKWYLDYITHELNTSIIYEGGFRYGPIEIHHCSELKLENGIIQSAIYWDNKNCILNAKDDLIECKLKNKTVTWTSKCSSFNTMIYKRGNKFIKWNCIQPLSLVRVEHFADVETGYGYAEQIETNILPWEFEFDNLLWGRFTSAEISIVWIALNGIFPKNLLLINGVETEPGKISDTEIVFSGGSLSIQNILVLREGNIISTLLSNMPSIKKIIPNTGLPIYEKKMLAKGILTLGEKVIESNIIHEVVKWK